MKTLKFEQIGRNCYNFNKAVFFNHHKIEVWPGFDIRMTEKESGVFLNIEPCHKVIRFESVLDYISDLRDTCDSKGLDFFETIEKEFERKTVVTRYNNRAY